MVALGSSCEGLAEVRVEPDGLDGCGGRADRWAAASPAQDLVDVVAGLGLRRDLATSSSVIGSPLDASPCGFLRHHSAPGSSR